MLSVLRCTDSDYAFGIFKLFSYLINHVKTLTTGRLKIWELIVQQLRYRHSDSNKTIKRGYLDKCSICVSGINITRYDQSQKIGEPNVLKIFS